VSTAAGRTEQTFNIQPSERSGRYFLLQGICIEMCWYRNGFHSIILFPRYSYWQGMECKPRAVSGGECISIATSTYEPFAGAKYCRTGNRSSFFTSTPSSSVASFVLYLLSVLFSILIYLFISLFVNLSLIFFHAMFHSIFPFFVSFSLFPSFSLYTFLYFKFCSWNVLFWGVILLRFQWTMTLKRFVSKGS
jgi:hypothetical protein